ncbi:MAG: hypothetical protein QXY15_10660 [Candidatus Nitrosotenuis sp.]
MSTFLLFALKNIAVFLGVAAALAISAFVSIALVGNAYIPLRALLQKQREEDILEVMPRDVQITFFVLWTVVFVIILYVSFLIWGQ